MTGISTKNESLHRWQKSKPERAERMRDGDAGTMGRRCTMVRPEEASGALTDRERCR